jgi:cellulose synthase/poly-beta-1,6-N-acetylglucosamine synthase-like glycosyltransferase
LDTCDAILSHDYPVNMYTVFVAAHNLLPETLEELKLLPLKLIEVNSDYGSKALSLQLILNAIDTSLFDLALILDADNILEQGALRKLNDAYQAGHKAIQLHRVAKNTDSALSYLEGVSEEINNNLFRQGPRALNLSASTIGSGMSFPIETLKEIYNLDGIIYNSACDRVVDFEIMKAGIEIEYLDQVEVKDEKVSSVVVFRKQRTRWIESQLIHIKLFFTQFNKIDFSSLNVWNKLVGNLFPPRIVILGLLIFINTVLLFPIFGTINPSRLWWLVLLIAYILTLAVSIPVRFYNFRFLKAIALLPVAFINMLIAYMQANPKRKEFIHTPKTYNGDRRKYKS